MAVLLDPPYWLSRFIQRLLHKQPAYQIREDYATGNHPLPMGDPRYVRALSYLQHKAKTNYVGLANKAVTDRMRIRDFRFKGERDLDALKIWRANNMALGSQVAISKAAELSDVYAMVSPPREEGGEPIITIEDPRTCITEPDPMDPYESIAGLKFVEDTILERVVAVLYFPDTIHTFIGPSLNDFLTRDTQWSPENIVGGSGGFRQVSVQKNPLGKVPIVRGAWQPQWGQKGMAECEDGGWDIQDRINDTILSRMVITRSQAYRQRWVTGASITKHPDGSAKRNPFEPGADIVWAVQSADAKFGDFEQADITQILEAARDDIGDFAAITQTPVTYLTNKMVNVSGETLTAAQVSLMSKTRTRMEAMGWFFERVMKLCFLYKGDTEKANDLEAEVTWFDPETHSMMELGDFASKMSAANLPVQVWGPLIGLNQEQVDIAVEEGEKLRQAEEASQLRLAAAKPKPQVGNK